MLEGGPYQARRVRTAGGLSYELESDGEPALAWTLHPYQLGEVSLRAPDGEPVLRITAEDTGEYVDAHFTVIDERSDAVVGHLQWTLRSLLRRHWALLDPHGIEVASVVASSRLRAVVRLRWLRFVPYRYALRDPDGATIGNLRGSLRPERAFALTLGDGADGVVDPRLAVGASTIVDAFEFR